MKQPSRELISSSPSLGGKSRFENEWQHALKIQISKLPLSTGISLQSFEDVADDSLRSRLRLSEGSSVAYEHQTYF